MKTDLVDVNDTRKQLHVEIPSDIVDAQIERVARNYSRKARIPGFRPGKAPARVIKQRFKEQILHDVAHDLIPQAVDSALRERGVEAVDTPDIRDVTVEEGRSLTFTASFDTLPAFDPGEYVTLSLRQTSAAVADGAVEQAMQRLRERAARYDPVEGRGIIDGDTVTIDLERHSLGETPERGEAAPARRDRSGGTEVNKDVNVEIGSKANPPGFDAELSGLEVGATKAFSLHYPADYAITELAGTDVSYNVVVKSIKQRVLPELDDELAKDLGDFETLDALRARVRADLEHEARHAADREVHADLRRQLAARLPFEVPIPLIEREIDRRIEDFARRLTEQNIDPLKAGIDWKAFRESQRGPAREAVASAIVLDEVARREKLEVTEADLEREIGQYAERSGRSSAAVRATLEKEGRLSGVYAGLRQEKSIDFVMARATIAAE